jgi:hypothetical protein
VVYNRYLLTEQDTCTALHTRTYFAVLLLIGVEEDVGVSVVELAILVLGPVGNLQAIRANGTVQ